MAFFANVRLRLTVSSMVMSSTLTRRNDKRMKSATLSSATIKIVSAYGTGCLNTGFPLSTLLYVENKIKNKSAPRYTHSSVLFFRLIELSGGHNAGFCLDIIGKK